MTGHRRGRAASPLDETKLNELMLAYVARFATSRAKLGAYLARKVRERGWSGAGQPPIELLVEKAARLGFVDDAAFALGKARALTARGYGARRVAQALHAAGVGESDGEAARGHAESEAAEAALRFARRRRLGPFGETPADAKAREKQLAAMLRAGHPLRLAKTILNLAPGTAPDPQALESE